MEELARSAACLDGANLPALVRLRDELSDLAAAAQGPELAGLAAMCRHAAEGVERILLRQTESVESVLEEIRAGIARAQEAADAAVSGACARAGRPAGLAGPAEPGAGGLVEFPAGAVIDETGAEFACEAREHIASAEQALLALESDLGNAGLINAVFRAFHTIKGVAGFLRLTPVVRLTHAAETLLDRARCGEMALTPARVDLLLHACDVLGQLIGAVQGGAAPTRAEYEGLMRRLEPACSCGLGAEAAPHGEVPVAPAARASQGRSGWGAEQTVRVSAGRLDSLMELVAELVSGYETLCLDETIRSAQDQRTQRTLGRLVEVIEELRETANSLRLVTLHATFQRFARLVRDVSARTGKQIVLHLEGEDVELDRGVVEAIGAPLLHMIRNACDHGIEPAPERLASGKPAAGHLWLRARREGGEVVIELADDGRGLDREKILKRAIEKGLHAPGPGLAKLADVEVYDLVFLPGFSTAERVTEISGRGMGMDVVRENVEALRGRIDIRSEPGRGTTFRMRLPPRRAAIDRVDAWARSRGPVRDS